MRIVTVLGARPQFIKAAVVSQALQQAGIDETLIHTGQHYDAKMSDIFFAELGIPPPGHHLGIGSASHGKQTGRMLEAIEEVVLADRPDWMLIYGDTNSTLAGVLAASKLHIPVAHVEAGLRSFNRRMPEEQNRIVADQLSELLFAPSQTAVDNLLREGIGSERIALVGDVMYDAALCFGAVADQRPSVLEALELRPAGYLLTTVHRAENTDSPERLRAIVAALRQVAERLPVVWPIHPRTRGILERAGELPAAGRGAAVGEAGLRLIEPLGYLDMLQLERGAALVATDSGGVQKEAFFHRVPCVTLRDETEWTEPVALGWNRLCPPDQSAEQIAQSILAALGTRGEEAQPYGDGRSAKKIADRLRESP